MFFNAILIESKHSGTLELDTNTASEVIPSMLCIPDLEDLENIRYVYNGLLYIKYLNHTPLFLDHKLYAVCLI